MPMGFFGNDDVRRISTGSMSRAVAETRTPPSCIDKARLIAFRNGALPSAMGVGRDGADDVWRKGIGLGL